MSPGTQYPQDGSITEAVVWSAPAASALSPRAESGPATTFDLPSTIVCYALQRHLEPRPAALEPVGASGASLLAGKLLTANSVRGHRYGCISSTA